MIKMTNNQRSNNQVIYLILDNIRSVHNVGSIFRTAETIGVTKIYCVGATPTPIDRFNRKRKDFAKVALGAEDLVPWEYSDQPIALAERLKKEGFQIIAVEQTASSIDYRKVKVNRKTAVVFGNEVEGVSEPLLKLADMVAEISLKGKKESLNVSVAAGISLFAFFE